MRSGSATLFAAMAGACALVVAPFAATALASTHLAQAVKISPPPNAGSSLSAYANAVACPQAGVCVAGGAYVDNSAHLQAMVAASASGKWARARELAMPAGADPSPQAEVNAIDCTGVGSCVAAGDYFTGNGTRLQGFLATESHGTWARARRITLPSNSAASSSFTLHAVSCPSAGACVAVGNYLDKSHHTQAMAAAESGGKWSQAHELAMPANAAAGNGAFALSVACPKAGACVAAADYVTGSGNAEVAVAPLSGGKWHQATELTMPSGAAANPQAELLGVTCTAVGSCVAVGRYEDSAFANFSFVAKESAGTWNRAAKFSVVPSNAAPNPQVDLRSVTCLKAGSCVAVGGYLDTNGAYASLAAVMLSGKWTGAAEIGPPPNARVGALLVTQPNSVSCTSAGYCAAVGSYVSNGGQWNAMAATTP